MLAVSAERRRELLRLIRLCQRERRRLVERDPSIHVLAEADVRRRTAPLVVCYGAGVDSTALLIEFIDRAIRPDLNDGIDAPQRAGLLAPAAPGQHLRSLWLIFRKLPPIFCCLR